MKGIVYNLLEDVVRARHGDDTWEEILEDAAVDGAYTSLGSYPDEELTRLVAATASRTGRDPEDVVRWFAREGFPILVQRHPQFFEAHVSVRTFLMTLNDIIHPEVRKIWPGAFAPSFRYSVPSPDEIRLEYSSPRRLCLFAEGLILGAADHFGETVEVGQSTCARRGDPACELVVRIRGPA